MIRVARGPEPAAIRRQRDYRLARARLARLDGAAVTDLDISGYDGGKQELYAAQRSKCVFCDGHAGLAGQPVEHFRPKKRAIRAGGVREEGYWWLAWTWENQLFACVTCNSAYKRDHFPLELDAQALPELSTDIASERAELVDPAREDPLQHIRFRQVAGNWQPVGLTPRGARTIELLGLDVERIDIYDYHVGVVRAAVERVREAMDHGAGDLVDVQRRWTRELAALFAPCAPYQSLSYWTLLEELPPAELDPWGLNLPLPGNFAVDPPSTDTPHAELANLPERLALRVRALGPAPTHQRRQEVILALCAHQPSTASQLVALLSASAAVVQAEVDALLAAGTLVETNGVLHVV